MDNPYKRLKEIKQKIDLTSARILVDAYIQSEQCRYMSIGYDPETAVKMAISHLDDIVKER